MNQMNNQFTNYLMNRRPTVITGANGQPIIIPPLNTDIRIPNEISQRDSSQQSFHEREDQLRENQKLVYNAYSGHRSQ
jgi:hypothetical protein